LDLNYFPIRLYEFQLLLCFQPIPPRLTFPDTTPGVVPNVISDMLKGLLKIREKPAIVNWNDPNRKNRNESAIIALYQNFPFQCVQCGLRFKDQLKNDKRLDWHFQKNQREKQKGKKAISRNWYLTQTMWIESENTFNEGKIPTPFEVEVPEENLSDSALLKTSTSITSPDDQMNCPACGEPLDQYWDSERDEWMCRDGSIGQDKLIYHTKCLDMENLPEDTTISKLEEDLNKHNHDIEENLEESKSLEGENQNQTIDTTLDEAQGFLKRMAEEDLYDRGEKRSKLINDGDMGNVNS